MIFAVYIVACCCCRVEFCISLTCTESSCLGPTMVTCIVDTPGPFLLDWEPRYINCQYRKSVGTRTVEHCWYCLRNINYPAQVLVSVLITLTRLSGVALGCFSQSSTMGIFFLFYSFCLSPVYPGPVDANWEPGSMEPGCTGS